MQEVIVASCYLMQSIDPVELNNMRIKSISNCEVDPAYEVVVTDKKEGQVVWREMLKDVGDSFPDAVLFTRLVSHHLLTLGDFPPLKGRRSCLTCN